MRLPDARPTAYRNHPGILFGAINHHARRRLEILTRVLSAIEDNVQGELASQERQWTNFRDRNPSQEDRLEYADFLSDERADLEAILRQARLFHIVGLYHTVEDALRTVFRWRLSGIPSLNRVKILRRIHKWKELADLTNTYFGFPIANVPGFATVNRLRLITNAVKHHGDRVSQELQAATRWKRGQEIDPTRVDFSKARELCLRFVNVYGQRAQRKTKKRYALQKPEISIVDTRTVILPES